MDDALFRARSIAERVRFSGDTSPLSTASELAVSSNRIRDAFYQNSVRISESVTPSLSASIKRVCERLSVPLEVIEAFVYASPEVSAECFAPSSEICTIRFSSALINLLDQDEFEFVAGHEIGHFLFGHGVGRPHLKLDSVETFVLQRRQEISVDRIGFLACQSLNSAIRALMKTVSGLDGSHVRFDVSAFVAQLKKISGNDQGALTVSTHPSIAIRCRALLWFSMVDTSGESTTSFAGDAFQRVDAKIEEDLSRYVDGPAQKIIKEAIENLEIWIAAYLIVEEKSFTKGRQNLVEELFGHETLKSLKAFLSEVPMSEISEAVFGRLQAARGNLEKLIPVNFETEVRRAHKRVQDVLYGN